MKIIIGLGNPGEKYKITRHNAGFIFVDKFKEKHSFPDFEFNKKFNAEITKQKMNDEEVVIAKPQTFMNNSGEAVRSLLDFYKLTTENIAVVHDDLDIALGKYKIATDSSSAGHHGVQDIFDKCGTQKITRLRIGVGQEKSGALVCRLDASEFVLKKMLPEEMEKIEKISGEMIKNLENWIEKTP